MGSEVCRAVSEEPGLELAARIGRGDPLELLTESGVLVAVDFTTPEAVKENVRWCLDHGIHAVVGTTGLGESDLNDLRDSAARSSASALVAPNFAIGAVLMMKFAANAARHFDSAEIVERHHEKKLDAPSGTALRTARLMNEARAGKPWRGATRGSETLPGARGGELAGIHIHSARLPGSVAHQEVILGSRGEVLTIRHDSLDRSSFMPGVLLAIKKVASLDGLVVGLEHLLDL